MLASTRVVIEHSNSGIKRVKMIKDTIRVNNTEFRDTVMVVAFALHNFRTIVRSVLPRARQLIISS
jgi:hypothetical protein